MHRIILNGDDFGYSDGVCRAIIELLDAGAISNTTLMSAAPGAQKRFKRWNVKQFAAVAGVHLQITDGKPLSGRRSVPSLVHRDGSFRPRSDFGDIDPVDVERECRAQIDCVGEVLGGSPSHLDTHHGFHRNERFTELYLTLAREYGLPVRGGENIPRQRLHAYGIRGSSCFVRGWTGQGKTTNVLKEKILEASQKMDSGDVLEVTTHPAYNDRQLERVSTMNIEREGDLKSIREIASEGWLAKAGLLLVQYPMFRPVSAETGS
jgi:predicted glycoside hydrolase/deacetylase ChbG (UPF0249 family)